MNLDHLHQFYFVFNQESEDFSSNWINHGWCPIGVEFHIICWYCSMVWITSTIRNHIKLRSFSLPFPHRIICTLLRHSDHFFSQSHVTHSFHIQETLEHFFPPAYFQSFKYYGTCQNRGWCRSFNLMARLDQINGG
jgi:hypothetical protein